MLYEESVVGVKQKRMKHALITDQQCNRIQKTDASPNYQSPIPPTNVAIKAAAPAMSVFTLVFSLLCLLPQTTLIPSHKGQCTKTLMMCEKGAAFLI